jgi:hypothetical protein
MLTRDPLCQDLLPSRPSCTGVLLEVELHVRVPTLRSPSLLPLRRRFLRPELLYLVSNLSLLVPLRPFARLEPNTTVPPRRPWCLLSLPKRLPNHPDDFECSLASRTDKPN